MAKEKLFLEESENLIRELQKAQESLGYLSEETVEKIAERLGVFPSQIYGVATFYSQFRLRPVGRVLIQVCHGTACHVRGAERVFEAFCDELGVGEGEITKDGQFTVEKVYCLGSCSLAPVVSANGRIYGRMSKEKVKKLLAELRGGKVD